LHFPGSAGLNLKLRWRMQSIRQVPTRPFEWIHNCCSIISENFKHLWVYYKPAIERVWRQRLCWPFHQRREWGKLNLHKSSMLWDRRLYCAGVTAPHLGPRNRIAVTDQSKSKKIGHRNRFKVSDNNTNLIYYFYFVLSRFVLFTTITKNWESDGRKILENKTQRYRTDSWKVPAHSPVAPVGFQSLGPFRTCERKVILQVRFSIL
jgi:hypothetical protein